MMTNSLTVLSKNEELCCMLSCHSLNLRCRYRRHDSTSGRFHGSSAPVCCMCNRMHISGNVPCWNHLSYELSQPISGLSPIGSCDINLRSTMCRFLAAQHEQHTLPPWQSSKRSQICFMLQALQTSILRKRMVMLRACCGRAVAALNRVPPSRIDSHLSLRTSNVHGGVPVFSTALFACQDVRAHA